MLYSRSLNTQYSCLGLDDYGTIGALLAFRPNTHDTPTTVLVRTGVSFISSQQACSNAENEIPDFDFDGTVASARTQWNELLGRIQVVVPDGQQDTRELLYSSVSKWWLRESLCSQV